MERKYIAFISYKHTKRDSAIAKRVHTLIENYIIPKSLRGDSRKLGIVFRDEEELPISNDLTASICSALDASRYLIVICSREASKSPWVAREVEYFLKHHDARNAFVVLADGEPAEVFPERLTSIYNPATQQYQEVEPLAMDVRADNISDSLKKVKSYIKKLYAAMLGCSYDSLVQREKTRRMKRFAAAGALFLLLAGCFTGMLFVKNQELSAKNDQLTAAIALALERESELLVEQAEEALEAGDVAEVFRYAGDALYSEEVERPYYAPAERAIFSAADVLREREDEPLMVNTELRHQTPIEMMAYNADGSAVYTIDTYGTASCFDAFTGDLLWGVKLRENENAFSSSINAQLCYDGTNGIVVCFYDGILTGLDAFEGGVLWQNELENRVEAGFFFDAEKQKLAYIEKKYILDPDQVVNSCYEHRFIAHSTRDGSVVNSVFFENMTYNAWDMSNYSFGSTNDVLFAGPDRFVGTLSRPVNDINETMLYIIDLAENAMTLIKNETASEEMDYMRTFYIGNDQALVLSKKTSVDLETMYSEQALWLQCFDLQAAKLLWEKEIELDNYMLFYAGSCVVPQSGSVVLAVGNQMYVLDRESGEVSASSQLKADILAMYPIMDGLFSFALADGYCAVGWSNQYGMYDSAFYSATVDLPNPSEVIFDNGGLIQAYITENMIDGFGILPKQEGGGSAAYLSQDRRTAYVASALKNPPLPERIPVECDDPSVRDVGGFIDMTSGGKALMGTASLEEGYALSVVDTEKHTLEVIALNEYLSTSDKRLFLTDDGQNVLICTQYGDIQILGRDNSISVIAQEEKMELKTVGSMTFVGSVYRADAARQIADGRVIAARSNGKELTLWTNGGNEQSVPLPGDVRWSVIDNTFVRSMVRVGENGLIVLSDFADGDGMEIESFVVYNADDGTWKQIPDAAQGSEERLIAFGQDSQVFAVYDADMIIRIYDCESGKPLHCIRTELPTVSVEKMEMLLDDRYVCVLTKDGQVMIYCADTNEMVFHTAFGGSVGAGNFTIWYDRENERLYLRANTLGRCIDARSWEQLFDAKNFRLYSAEHNEVYTYKKESAEDENALKAIPIPTTEELIHMVRETLY